MAITDKTRKILWAKSGNRCAICMTELVMPDKTNMQSTVVGDECHIVSKKLAGPRYDPKSNSNLDRYENLILLCKNHHKKIDEEVDNYTTEKLKEIKTQHEEKINKIINQHLEFKYTEKRKTTAPEIIYLPKIHSGKELANLLFTDAFCFDNDPLNTLEETNLIAKFSQLLHDWVDILGDVNTGDIVKLQFDLQLELNNLEELGFFVFGIQRKEKFKTSEISLDLDITTVCVIRSSNLAITTKPDKNNYLQTIIKR